MCPNSVISWKRERCPSLALCKVQSCILKSWESLSFVRKLCFRLTALSRAAVNLSIITVGWPEVKVSSSQSRGLEQMTSWGVSQPTLCSGYAARQNACSGPVSCAIQIRWQVFKENLRVVKAKMLKQVVLDTMETSVPWGLHVLSQHRKLLEVTEEKVLCGTSASTCQTSLCVGLDLSKHAHHGPGIASMTLQEQFSSVYFEVAAGAKEAGTFCALLHCLKADAGPQWKMELFVLGAWPVLFTFFRMEACNWEVLAVFLLVSREKFLKQLPWWFEETENMNWFLTYRSSGSCSARHKHKAALLCPLWRLSINFSRLWNPLGILHPTASICRDFWSIHWCWMNAKQKCFLTFPAPFRVLLTLCHNCNRMCFPFA